MESITVKSHLNIHQPRKDGTCGLYLRITIDRKSKFISLRKFIDPKNFDFKTKRVKIVKAEPNAAKINRFLAEEEKNADDIILEIQRKGKKVTFDSFKTNYEGEQNELFVPWCRKEIEKQRSQLKRNTLELDEFKLNKIELYQENLTISEIDKNWLENYRKYLKEKLGNKINTVNSDLRIIRKYIRRAMDEGLVSDYPFKQVRIQTEETEKEYLTISELNELQKLYKSGKLLKQVKKDKRGKTYCIGKKYQELLQHFLIACYTGLRHSDIRNLRYGNIRENKIIIKMQKGRIGKQKTVRIPLTGAALSVLDLKNKKDDSDMIYSGNIRNKSDTNRWIKEIMDIAEIKKYITFHCSRHTFAINSLVLGIPIEVVSDLLGHRDLKTTQIYAKIVDKKREDEMAKWEKFSK